MILTLRPLTYEDLLDLPDDGLRYEILGGELIVTPASTAGHQRVLGRLSRRFNEHVCRTEAGEAILGPFDVRLSRFDTVKPDIIFIGASQPPVSGDQNFIDFAPALVVEVISPTSRRIELVRKMALYANAGIQEYWVADPEWRTFAINVLAVDEYIPVELATDGWLESRVLPGLRVDPAEVFAGLN
jgi:Uma2 family endonuclease